MFRFAVVILCVPGMTSTGLCQRYTTDSLDMVKSALAEKKALLIDVREQNEWEEGHLEGALLFPLSRLSNRQREELLKNLPRDKPIYIHCKSGIRCLRAAEILNENGYKALPMKQGYDDLIKAGFNKAG